MLDPTSALINTRMQVRWEAMRRVDRLELLFPACSNHPVTPFSRWLVALGEALIRLGQRLINENHTPNNLQPSTYNPCR
jgi:hypothetical protein